MHHLNTGVSTPDDNTADLARQDAELSRRQLFGRVGGALAVGGLGLLALSSQASAQSRPVGPGLPTICRIDPNNPRCRPRPRPGWKK
jgi:hypothetical protein